MGRSILTDAAFPDQCIPDGDQEATRRIGALLAAAQSSEMDQQFQKGGRGSVVATDAIESTV
jgi:hypothetical protein